MRVIGVQKAMEEVGLVPVATLVIWLGCVTVGVIGLLWRYPRPRPPKPPPAPVVAQVVHVELTNDTSAIPDIGAGAQPTVETAPQPPAMPSTPATPPAPALTAVAAPSPSIAFEQPVEGPTCTVEPKAAVPVRSPPVAATQTTSATAPVAPGPQRLVFGEGEARQPAPEYPREAALAHQEGTVVVRFTVGEDGRVQAAQAVTTSPFALLNQAAVRAVRETWRFRPGSARSYEVSIEFQLKKR